MIINKMINKIYNFMIINSMMIMSKKKMMNLKQKKFMKITKCLKTVNQYKKIRNDYQFYIFIILYIFNLKIYL